MNEMEPSTASSEELVVIGRVFNARGLHGEIKIEPISNVYDRFTHLRTVVLEFPDGGSAQFDVDYAKYSGVDVIVKLQGVDDRDKAEQLRKAYISVTRDNIAPLGDSSYYIFDLVGLEVFDTADTKIGIIEHVEEYPANSVLIIRKDNERIMVPAIRSYILQVDVKARKVIVDLPEGLPNYPKQV